MADSVQIAVFEGGKLTVHRGGEKSNEAVLALPLSRLLVKMVRVPEENRGDPAAFAMPMLQAASPFPDDPLTVSCETVRDSADGLVVLAAALPEGAVDDIAGALDEEKLNVTRVDAIALGRLRELWAGIGGGRTGVRRLVLIGGEDCISLFVLDDDLPSAVRALSRGSDLRREAMLSLLEAEDFGGAMPLAEVVVVGDVDPAGLEAFAPVRRLEADETSVRGIAERSADPNSLNALPASWKSFLEETRFKAKLVRYLSVAGGIWALVMLVLFGVPAVYGMMTSHMKTLSSEHRSSYNKVKEVRDKVKLVQKYSDHARGALEILKAVSDRLPEGVELNSWNFKREDGVRFSGESEDAASVYTLKDSLLETGAFGEVKLTGPSAGKGGRQKFDIDCRYQTEEQ
ncbi:MAG: PilN domain-containing protein [Kiritimatiellae bacterium]|nr:PilN domain-containing protein [Kiritimatiellia bacterium]